MKTHYKGYKIFHLKRVSYGKSTTPLESREYNVIEFPTSAIGTINEIADFIRDKLSQYKKIVLRTSDSGDFKFNFLIED